MALFHLIPDAKAITRSSNGLFRQVDLYRYNDKIFIKHNGGFAWILKSLGKLETSVTGVSIYELVLPFEEAFNVLGYLALPAGYSEK